jgi:Bifunctional DNA primase/polymerase, N-terminal
MRDFTVMEQDKSDGIQLTDDAPLASDDQPTADALGRSNGHANASGAHSPRDVRLRLREAGYLPIPVRGKIPPLTDWQKKLDVTADEIASWDAEYPNARSTGVLTLKTVAIDIDLLKHPEAADAVEKMVRERFGSRGKVLVRFGQRPKRLIPLRTDAPFKKKQVAFEAESKKPPAIEILCDGQHFVVDGIHPDTNQPYAWLDGSPMEVKHADLQP